MSLNISLGRYSDTFCLSLQQSLKQQLTFISVVHAH